MNTPERTTLPLRIEAAHMEAFATFCGDRSALHMDPAYGRRSRFGDNLVHGMLPLMALPLLLHRCARAGTARVRAAQARFLQPIMPGDDLLLAATLERDDHGPVVAFEVRRTKHDQVATRGKVLLVDTPARDQPTTTAAAPLPRHPLDEAEHPMAGLSTGMATSIPFEWGAGQRASIQQLLVLLTGAAPTEVEHTLRDQDPLAFALLALLSTQVGMVMPGRTATFQEFELELEHPDRPEDGPGELRSTVTFLSASTNTLTQEVVFTLGDRSLASGKVVAQVARPPFVPPTMAELAGQAMDTGLRDKVVLITGAARGLGATTAKLFALHGARVVVNYRSAREQAEAVVADIHGHGGRAMAVQADVTDANAVRTMVEQVRTTWGPVDVLVNSAAGNFHPTPFEQTTWEQVQADLDVILKGAFNATQAVLPGMTEAGGGCIVNLSTVAVETPPRDQSKYVMAKSALNGLTRSLAVELAVRNIRVNMVVPGMVETDFTRGINRVTMAQLKASTPLKRLAEPQEVAQAIVHLASRQSSFTTGQKLLVTGGLPPFL